LSTGTISDELAKTLTIKNLAFLIATAKNFHVTYPEFGFEGYSQSLQRITGILESVTNPTISGRYIEEIEEFVKTFADKEFSKRHFYDKDFSDKLIQFWSILKKLVQDEPESVVGAVIAIIEKNIPPGVDKNELILQKATKFISKTKNVNSTTESILQAVNERLQRDRKVDILFIAGILLLLVGQRESNIYYIIENLKKAQSIANTTYDINDICSIDSKVTQNTIEVSDTTAIRNCISHFAHKIEKTDDEIAVDFHSDISGYDIDRKYTGRELISFYRNYDRLIGIQELFIRSAFLQALISLYFTRPA
jgi:hypothetical protein